MPTEEYTRGVKLFVHNELDEAISLFRNSLLQHPVMAERPSKV
jgi:hypothetical protein